MQEDTTHALFKMALSDRIRNQTRTHAHGSCATGACNMLPSKHTIKIDKLMELSDFSREVFNFLGSRLASGLAWTPGWPWPRGTKAEMGQGSIWVQK